MSTSIRTMLHQLLYVVVLTLIIQYNILVLSKYGVAAAADATSTSTTTATQNDNDSATTKYTNDIDEIDAKDFEKFLMACSQGDIDTVKEYIEKDTAYYVTAYSKNGGESCLHVAGILGQSSITQYILQHGGNPNQRSQNAQDGLRMTPLSWNVYGNHIENAQLLLEAGADVNLDFDYVMDGTLQKVTVFDLLLYINSNIDLENNTDTEDKTSHSEEKLSYIRKVQTMYALLEQHGAKRYTELDRIKSTNSNQKGEL